MKTKLERYLSREISIKYKAGVYHLCQLFYCACYLFWQKQELISLWQLAQLVFFCYTVCSIQVYALKNFDEWDRLTVVWWLYAIICTAIYLLIAWLFNWFDGHLFIWLGFGFWQLFCYVCIYVVNKIKRRIDSQHLNQLLKTYKLGREQEHD